MRQVEGDSEDPSHFMFYMKFEKYMRHAERRIEREDFTFIVDGLSGREFNSFKETCQDITQDYIEAGKNSQAVFEPFAIEDSVQTPGAVQEEETR